MSLTPSPFLKVQYPAPVLDTSSTLWAIVDDESLRYHFLRVMWQGPSYKLKQSYKVQTWRGADPLQSKEMLIINIICRCRFAVIWRSRPAGLFPVRLRPGTLSRFTTSQSTPYSPGLRRSWRRRSRACWRTSWTGAARFWRATPAAAPRLRREWRVASTFPRAPLGSRTWTVVTERERTLGAQMWRQEPGNNVVKAVQGNVSQWFVSSLTVRKTTIMTIIVSFLCQRQ